MPEVQHLSRQLPPKKSLPALQARTRTSPGADSGTDSPSAHFALLVRHHRLDLYAWFCRRVRLAEDAEELTCQVFTDVWRKWSEYGHLEPWPLLLSFASRLLYQHHRARGRCARFLQRIEHLLGELSSRTLFDTVLEQAERAARLDLCLKALHPLLRRIVEMRYWGELTDQEIAERLEAEEGRAFSQDSVKQRRLRVMPRLQTCLETEGVPHV